MSERLKELLEAEEAAGLEVEKARRKAQEIRRSIPGEISSLEEQKKKRLIQLKSSLKEDLESDLRELKERLTEEIRDRMERLESRRESLTGEAVRALRSRIENPE